MTECVGGSDAPESQAIPTSGDDASLTIVVSGADQNEADANNVVVEINGQDYSPHYTGLLDENYAEAVGGAVDRLVQINLGIKAKAPHGIVSARVKTVDGKSDAVSIEFLKPQPVIPKITLVSNCIDGGVDVHARGDKAVFRVFASGLDDSATPDNVRVHVNRRILKPDSVSFIPANGVHMAVAKMPEEIAAGEAEIRLQFSDLVSLPAKVNLIG